MKIIPVSQDDRAKWLEERWGKIGGSTAKKLYPLKYGEDKTPQGFWDLVGEMLTIMPDGEAPMSAGHTHENEAIDKLSEVINKPFNNDAQMWQSSKYSRITVSPDGAEPGSNPTYACEVKNLGVGKHFKYLYKARGYKGNPINLVPNEAGAFYKEQAIQYFVVNEELQDLYFGLHNKWAMYKEHELVIIHVRRSDVRDLIILQEEIQRDSIKRAQTIIRELTIGLKI